LPAELYWEDLALEERLQKVLKGREDPVYFCQDPYFLNLTLWPMEIEIIRRFIWGVPKAMEILEWQETRAAHIKKDKMEEFNSKYVQIYHDLAIEAGMNSGKTFMASCIGLQQAFELLSLKNPVEYYGASPGTEFFILNVATSDEQAHDTIFAQEKGKVENSPFFQYLKPRTKYNEFRFTQKSVIIRCGGSNSGSLVGRNVKCALFDELARFKDTRGERSGWEVYHGLGRGTKKVPALKAKRVAISSTLYVGDIIDYLYEMSKRVDTMLGYKYATWEMNPTLTKEVLADEFEKDPDSAWRDYGVAPTRAIEKYYGDPSIIGFNDKRVNPMLPDGTFKESFMGDPGFDYVLTGDPAIKMDSFGLALGHLTEENKVYIDYVHRIAPKLEVDPTEVVNIINHIKSRFNLQRFIVDQWNYPETIKKVQDSGIDVVFNVVKLPQHDRLKEAWKLKEIDCYEHEALRIELVNLEIHRGRKVDHPRRGSKDIADALAQLVWDLTSAEREVREWSPHYYRRIITRGPMIVPVMRSY